ncbi:DUF2813 domain-containing protein [Polyangium sp. y55x31]|uniref:ATP-dependent nuclease n=1 Tax=Polyangium sp. y55x31 TaxID=3042688 RepID=UPI0024822144|nr:DUF2813 domain-containing protein [Polyangium sp. y55x31]MDI1480381.1 DUF2813 domain-containing protein [Polyangium sp. y55x31]
MKLKQIRIRNFRSLVDVTLPLEDTTVLLGENNVGKTAVLDAIKFFLANESRLSGVVHEVHEYDVHLPDETAAPRASEGFTLDATFAESSAGEWPAAVSQGLSGVIQEDPITGIGTVQLRLNCRYTEARRAYMTKTEFLASSGQPLDRNAEDQVSALQRYVPAFYLSALRDAEDAFSGRSPLWGRILRSLDLPEAERRGAQEQMDRLNEDLMKAEPRIRDIRTTLGKTGDVVATGTGERIDVRALPLKLWELLSRAEVVLRGRGNTAFFPLSRHGQGAQSLSVLFLFEAFCKHALELLYEKESTPLLMLEEPEAHLHPHAARALWAQVEQLPGQKIITTHSPYFAQHVPIRSLRILRKRGACTTVHWLPAVAEEPDVPWSEKLDDYISKSSIYEFRRSVEKPSTGTLVIKRKLEDDEYRQLQKRLAHELSINDGLHARLDALERRAAALLTDHQLRKIEACSRRTRGEIFFARCWLLCEGQSEIAILPRFADMLNISLDANGISLIDYQNDGSPGAFAALARALGIPWFMFCDDDDGGKDHMGNIEKSGFTPGEMAFHTRKLPGIHLEGYLVQFFAPELLEIASVLKPGFTAPLVDVLGECKPDYARLLALKLANADPDRVPAFFREILQRCVEVARA